MWRAIRPFFIALTAIEANGYDISGDAAPKLTDGPRIRQAARLSAAFLQQVAKMGCGAVASLRSAGA